MLPASRAGEPCSSAQGLGVAAVAGKRAEQRIAAPEAGAARAATAVLDQVVGVFQQHAGIAEHAVCPTAVRDDGVAQAQAAALLVDAAGAARRPRDVAGQGDVGERQGAGAVDTGAPAAAVSDVVAGQGAVDRRQGAVIIDAGAVALIDGVGAQRTAVEGHAAMVVDAPAGTASVVVADRYVMEGQVAAGVEESAAGIRIGSEGAIDIAAGDGQAVQRDVVCRYGDHVID